MKSITLGLLSALFFLAGCRSVPPPRVLGEEPIRGSFTNYTYSQAPTKTVLQYSGKEYDQHLKLLQKMNLEHERTLVQIEHKANVDRVAKEKGVKISNNAQVMGPTVVTNVMPQVSTSIDAPAQPAIPVPPGLYNPQPPPSARIVSPPPPNHVWQQQTPVTQQQPQQQIILLQPPLSYSRGYGYSFGYCPPACPPYFMSGPYVRYYRSWRCW